MITEMKKTHYPNHGGMTKMSEITLSRIIDHTLLKADARKEDIVKLAIDNDAAFIPLFKQNFPYFYDNLKSFNKQMTGEEFKFCALLKLGFTTKDIAEYNHFTVRTVQTKKNRLRKSFNIPSEKDLYAWIDGV